MLTVQEVENPGHGIPEDVRPSKCRGGRSGRPGRFNSEAGHKDQRSEGVDVVRAVNITITHLGPRIAIPAAGASF